MDVYKISDPKESIIVGQVLILSLASCVRTRASAIVRFAGILSLRVYFSKRFVFFPFVFVFFLWGVSTIPTDD